MPIPHSFFPATLLFLAATVLACDEVAGPTTGAIRITVLTAGADIDSDGYTLTVDGASGQAVSVNAAITIPGLSAGNHSVRLGGLAANCSLSGTNPRLLDVIAGETVSATFTVSCVAQTGSIRVTTTTTGTDLDTDGYNVNLNNDYCYYGPCPPIATNGSLTLGDLPVGQHTVFLEGVHGNCTVAGANPRTVSVTLGATTEVSFAIQCTPLGSLRVTVATTGVDLDPSYTINMQGPSSGSSAGSSSTVTFSAVPGDYLVSISDLAANCDVAGTNPRAVAVSSGAETAVAFEITCALATQLAFVNGADGNAEIYTINSNGTGATRLTSIAAADVDPAWSPNGGKIAFATSRDGNFEIYVMNADGSNLVRLTNVTAADYRPTWSPDGTRIAFVSERDGNAEIYAMNADGTSPVRLTNHTARDGDPAWSPDGNKIAFSSQRDGNAELYVMNADGSSVARLTFNELGDAQPAWSPDGTKIAFSRGVCCGSNATAIFVIGSDGSSLTRLTSSSNADTDPTWSADGRKIAFSVAGCDYYTCFSDIRVVKADGTGLADVTLNGNAANPAWRP